MGAARVARKLMVSRNSFGAGARRFLSLLLLFGKCNFAAQLAAAAAAESPERRLAKFIGAA